MSTGPGNSRATDSLTGNAFALGDFTRIAAPDGSASLGDFPQGLFAAAPGSSPTVFLVKDLTHATQFYVRISGNGTPRANVPPGTGRAVQPASWISRFSRARRVSYQEASQ